MVGSQYDLVDLEPHQLQAWGEAVAKVHQVAPTGNGRPDWQTYLDELMPCVPRTNTLVHDVAKDITTRLSKLDITPETYGLIHFDAELDNIVWQAGKPMLLDFDDCCNMWFVADIAFALRDVFVDDPSNVDLRDPRLQTFVDGYRQVRPLSDDDLIQLPLMLSFHNLVMFAKLQRTRDSLASHQQYPDWVRDLDDKLAQVMAQYQRQFEAYEFGER